ncbi:MAG: hypothetical protein WC145_12825 [Aliarcobacter sp.]
MDYIENHDLRVDESGSAGAHVTVRIQDTDLETARRFVRSILGVAETFSWEGDECTLPETHYEPGGGAIEREIVILRPQVDGPCIHYGPDGCEVPGGVCPHLDNPDVLCPVKDACYAMRDVARMRDACEAEQAAQDDDMVARELVYETAAPEWVEPAPDDGAPHTYTVPATRKPTNPNAWSDEEIEVIRRAQSAAEAGRLYVDAFPESNRTVAAVSSRWYKLRAAGKLIEPEPEEPDFIVPHPTYRPGDRVRIKHALHRGQTGKIERYFPATENYLVAIDGVPDMIILQDSDLEAV